MSIVEIVHRLKKLDQLILAGDAGTVNDLATKLGVSSRSIHTYINVLRKTEGPIVYDRKLRSYKYDINNECD